MPYTAKQISVSLKSSDGTDITSGLCFAEIGDINMTADDIDVTCYGPGNTRKKIPGLIDLGTLDITVNYKDHTTATNLYNAFTSRVSITCTLTMLGTTPNEVLTFSAYISALGQTQAKDDVIQHPLTLSLDGVVAPYWSTVTA